MRPSKPRVKVHPLLLRRVCKEKNGTSECIHFQPGSSPHPAKCMWFGHDFTCLWARTDECIADAKAGLIDDLESDEAAE